MQLTPAGELPPSEIDEARAEAFGQRMAGVLNDACLALLTSIGHQLGLFDTLAGLPPSTSQQVADAAGLQERYVREWLAGMTTSGVVEYDPSARSYRLPPEHAASLTRAAGPDNLAAVTQYIPLLASVEQPLIACFRDGGGVPYSDYVRFHRLMAEDSAAVHDVALLEGIVPLVSGLADRLRAGIDVADIGCGSGHAVNLLADAFPASRFVGYDFSEEAIEAARREAQALGLSNATFERRDVTDLGQSDRFDLITAFDTIHDQAHPAEVLAGVASALRADGVFLMVDIQASSNLEDNLDHPLGTFVYGISTMHCMTVSLALDGDGLGTAWGEQRAQQMLADAGFASVETAHVEADILNTYYVARKT
ncbi:MAG TPA: class I SAM-dependent methyltransferase [Acidimicrobiales bacterium]|nr:class I SAM-dependent methyltransferase [Acidimicrobiales bacterium]